MQHSSQSCEPPGGRIPGWSSPESWCTLVRRLQSREEDMGTYYYWLKALHIAFMVTWFAGLLYLPRLFIYHAQASDTVGRERFTVMERRLFAITTIGALLTTGFGASLLIANQILLQAPWMQLKLAFVAGLLVYHYRCYCWVTVLRDAESIQDTKWLRWFNEIPVIFLLGVVLLAVLKPY